MALQRVETAEQFRTEYPRVRPWLSKALKRQIGGGDEKELLSGLQNDRYTLWASETAACVTSIVELDGVKLISLYLVAGKSNAALHELRDDMEVIQAFGRTNGCKGFFGSGRAGWEKVLSPLGFKAVSINYYKEFDQ